MTQLDLFPRHLLRRPRYAGPEAERVYVSECHCGEKYAGDTLAEVREQHRLHRSRQQSKTSTALMEALSALMKE